MITVLVPFDGSQTQLRAKEIRATRMMLLAKARMCKVNKDHSKDCHA